MLHSDDDDDAAAAGTRLPFSPPRPNRIADVKTFFSLSQRSVINIMRATFFLIASEIEF